MLTREQVKELNRARLDDAARQKAEEFKAKSDADAVNGWNAFLARHSGQLAIAKGEPFHSCEANHRLLEIWISEQGLLVSERALELSYRVNKHRLAQAPEKEYVRRTNTQQSLHTPQIKTYAPPPVRAPHTRQQLLEFSKEQLSAAVRKYGLTEINRVLREQE